MNIGLFGATGAIGERILNEALSRGHAVTAFARSPSRVGMERTGVAWKVADILISEDVRGALDDLDVLVSSYGVGPRSDASGAYTPASVASAINDSGALVAAARSLLAALERRPSLRLIVVGGAASLEVAPRSSGRRLGSSDHGGDQGLRLARRIQGGDGGASRRHEPLSHFRPELELLLPGNHHSTRRANWTVSARRQSASNRRGRSKPHLLRGFCSGTAR